MTEPIVFYNGSASAWEKAALAAAIGVWVAQMAVHRPAGDPAEALAFS